MARRGLGNAPLTPGGSSGGSAAAVAADLCLGATATDTGGSIRQPAAFTGTVGIKPTYGRCSRWGIVAFASSLDQAGPIAKTVEDAAILLRSMAGHDPKDSTSLPIDGAGLRGSFVGKSVKGLRIGVPKEYRVDGMPAEIEQLWEQGVAWLKDAGCEIVEISPAAHQVRPAGLLHRRAGRGLVQPRPLRRHALRPARRRRRTSPRSTRRPAPTGFGAEVQAPHHDRHLCALGRLLRRLLPARRRRCAAASPTTSTRRSSKVRRDPDADDALGGLRHRREGRTTRSRCT